MTEKRPDVATIEAFVLKGPRERCLTLLQSARGRAKLRQRLAHEAHLDPRYARKLSTAEQHCVGDILRKAGAPDRCYVLSEDRDLDGREMALDTALEEVVGRGMGAFISCIPGRLAYYEGEDVGERYVLQRAI